MNKGKKNDAGRAVLLLCTAVLLAVCTVLGGCGGGGDSARTQKPQSTSKGVDDVLQAGVEEYDSGAQKSDETAQDGNAQSSDRTGAAQSADDSGQGTPAVSQPGAGTVPTQSAESSEEPKDKGQTAGAGEVDVDLTAMSSTIVYSEVFNMVSNPDSYIGKTVRMEGPCSVYQDENTGVLYYACIIQDATACCAQGMEFELDETYDRPDDYPKEGEEVTVEGTFDTYMENGYLYCTLRDGRLIDG